jgi:hypothetical protein
MFDYFDGLDKKEAQNLKRKMERAEREEYLQMEEKKVGLLEKLTILIEQKLVEQKENVQEKSKVTFGASDTIFETKGYRFNTLVVSESFKDKVLVIEYDLEQFEMVLNSGFNRLNLPNGCLVKSKDGTPLSVSLIKSKEQF